MKAAILETIDSPLVIGEVGLTELSIGQVLVKIQVSGICGSQLQEIVGNKGNAKFVPHLMGHEGCGVVQEVGPGVTKVKPGDKVVMHWRKGDGIEADFPSYTYKGKTMKSGKVTTFSEYSIVSENRITPVPSDTPEDFCALLGCGLSTALGVIDNEVDLKVGESFVVVGVGGLGLNLIRAAKLVSAYPVIAIDIYDNKADAAIASGADLYINSSSRNIKDAIKDRFDLSNVDVIVDTSGNSKAIANTMPLMSGVGRYVMLGHPRPGETVEMQNANHMFEGEGKHICATQGGRFSPTRDIPRYVNLYRAGLLKIDNLITHRVKLEKVNEAIELVRDGQAGRILIEM